MKYSQIQLFFFLVSSYCVNGQGDSAIDLKKLEEEVPAFLKTNTIPAISIAVSQGNELLWLEGYGLADLESETLVTPQHLFPIGSVAKSFTATGIMILVNDGLLQLTDKLTDIVPDIHFYDINGNEPDIRVWHILSMTAGFNHGWVSYLEESDIPMTGVSYSESYWNENVIVAFEPGTVYEYSNFSMGVAQLICETISNQSFEKFMKNRLFDPLGMKNTITIYDPLKKGLVKKYNSDGILIDYSFGTPSGGLGFWSSAEDLLIYGQFHLGVLENDKVISKELLKVQHNFNSGVGDLFSLGWFKSENALISNGNVAGGNASIKLFPKEKLVIVSMINRTSWNSLADTWLGKIENQLYNKPNNPDEGYKSWKRIYRSDYVPTYDVLGKWKGVAKTPKGELIGMEVSFEADSSINITIEDNKYQVNNTALNLLGDINGNFHGVIDIVSKDVWNFDIHFHLYEKKILGYLAYRGATKNVNYRKPLYISLEKSL